MIALLITLCFAIAFLWLALKVTTCCLQVVIWIIDAIFWIVFIFLLIALLI